MNASAAKSPDPTFSIVICTDGRSVSLSNTLRSLRYLDGPSFEVCVVRGPAEDGIEDVLSSWRGEIKVGRNHERNLSMSRNLGIGMAAGELIAFLDDDAIPEPEWLQDLAAAFTDPHVGGAGGFVYDHTGKRVQWNVYSSADRLGNAHWSGTTPHEDFNFPFSFNFPYVQGTNCCFRRTALLSCGGFDEEFEYYLDETDLCCRLVDAGWTIKQLPTAFVHHKYLASAVRNEHRVFRVWYPILKNKIYFSLVNGWRHYDMHAVIKDGLAFVEQERRQLEWAAFQGHLSETDCEGFSRDVDRAWRDGLTRGLANERKLAVSLSRGGPPALYLPVRTIRPNGGRLTICVISRKYPDSIQGGSGHDMQQLVQGLACAGHHVHVLTASKDVDCVDLEDNVWVHRIVPRSTDRPDPPPEICVPPQIWDHAATMLAEIREIAAKRRIDCVYAPIWNCAGIAVLFDGQYRLIAGLPSIGHSWVGDDFESDGDALSGDLAEVALALEKRLLDGAQMIHAASRAAVDEASALFDLALDDRRMVIVSPAGDWATLADRIRKALPLTEDRPFESPLAP